MSIPILKVRVLSKEGGSKWIGYYGHRRRKAGDEFILESPIHFSHRWMEPIGWEPEGYKKPEAPAAKKLVSKLPRTPMPKDPNKGPAPEGIGQAPAAQKDEVI